MRISDRKRRLEQLLSSEPSTDAWDELVRLLLTWPKTRSLDLAVEDTERGLANWPDRYRVTSESNWLYTFWDPTPPPPPYARLGRSILVEGKELARRLPERPHTTEFLGLHTELHFSTVPTRKDLAASLAKLPNVRALRLDHLRVGNTRFCELVSAPIIDQIVLLSAEGCSLEPGALVRALAQARLGPLHTLSLIGNRLGLPDFAALASHPVHQTLRVLRLGRTGCLPNEGDTSPWPNLEELDLSYCGVVLESVSGLRAMLSGAPSLKVLDLSGSYLSDDGLRMIQSSIPGARIRTGNH